MLRCDPLCYVDVFILESIQHEPNKGDFKLYNNNNQTWNPFHLFPFLKTSRAQLAEVIKCDSLTAVIQSRPKKT